MHLRIASFLSIFLCACLLHAMMADSGSLGFAKSPGDFRVDGSAVHSNATVFEGTRVETGKFRAEIILRDGGSVSLAPDSSARLQRGLALLESGQGLIRGAEKVSARTLSIFPTTKQYALQVVMNPDGHVLVAGRQGVAEVRNQSGVVVARVFPSIALDLNTETNSSPDSVMVTGCVEQKKDKYVVTDSTTHVEIELQGPEINKDVNKQVQATGTIAPGVTSTVGASQIVKFIDVKVLGKCKDGAAPALPASRVAVIGGVAVAGTIVGLASAGSFTGSSVSAP